MVIDHFNQKDIEQYSTDHNFVKSYSVQLDKYESQSCLRVDFDMTGWTKGNGAIYITFNKQYKTYKRPRKLGVFVHSDGIVPWLRANIRDGNGQLRTVNLTEETLSWHGWKYVDADIGDDWPTPLYLERIYVVEVDKAYRGDPIYRGSILFSNINFIYIDDIDKKGPSFHDLSSYRRKIYTDLIYEQIEVTDEQSGIDETSIEVYLNGKVIPYHFDGHIILIEEPVKGEGLYTVKIVAKDKAGNQAIPYFEKTVEVDLSEDKRPPSLESLTPVDDELIYTRRPRITFNIKDNHTGVDSADVFIKVNEKEIPHYYDEKSGWGYALPVDPLNEGDHIYQVIAYDRAGNRCESKRVPFIIRDLTEDKLAAGLIVLPDTHNALYLQAALETIKDEQASMVLHMGDIVDGATIEEYKAVYKVLTEERNKIYFHLAGNHESFLGHLADYRRFFGSPTYHLDFGHLLLVVLNSAFNQSISESDSSQFHYLSNLLESRNWRDVIIATHVPYQDHLGTEHQMGSSDVQKMRQIIKEYKSKNKAVRFTHLFGHLHVNYHWEDELGDYYIAGNHSYKGYVDEESGNLLGYGRLILNRNSIAYTYIPSINHLSIRHGETEIQHLCLELGESLALHMTGKVHLLQTSYTVDLLKYPLVKKTWHIENESIVNIIGDYIIRGNQRGRTTLTLKVGKQIRKIDVTVV
ncbi:MAG TPA: Ig-like domain-containing protein [Pseudogracilibacillus sp.]|nr:Ig-like domain-containing protein [Pseudogracilibacillus sp.]